MVATNETEDCVSHGQTEGRKGGSLTKCNYWDGEYEDNLDQRAVGEQMVDLVESEGNARKSRDNGEGDGEGTRGKLDWLGQSSSML